MEQWSSIRTGSALAALVFSAAAFALEAPTGTEVQIRVKTKISTRNSRPQDPVEAVVIAPVMVGDQFAMPAGNSAS